ncbi:hypothetical protein GCM10011519_20750 [Marmoricola endophyticus]|uniref:Cardiolipin synthase N-terminal domain-containing protein n=1 Tax=Marmoricola endophyticus TaxID=2040280 RepID=A0A917BI17_9ACTN|nr:PLDc N-terminal domain-containing protein [Marmoricola endophyticus]GGF46605.1 hypothetical protein GCM10011519_20750 [Marmoricola endophyticus]
MRTILYILEIIIFVYITIDVWRSPASVAKKVIWTVVAFLFSIITLIVWLVWGRKNAYQGSTV